MTALYSLAAAIQPLGSRYSATAALNVERCHRAPAAPASASAARGGGHV
jgi:hypothetical protein